MVLSGEQAFGALSVFDVGIRSEPFDNLAIVVERRSRTEEKPTIHAIETAQSSFNFTWLARSQNRSPVVHKSVQIVRVKGSRPAPITRPFGRKAGIFEPALIEEVSGAVLTSGPRERRNRVKHKTNVLRLMILLGAMLCGCHRVIIGRLWVRADSGAPFA